MVNVFGQIVTDVSMDKQYKDMAVDPHDMAPHYPQPYIALTWPQAKLVLSINDQRYWIRIRGRQIR